MYLKQIIAQGFKSFADKTTIDLQPGITGIVGPNGSGKSNVVDAVRWVLGEQSIKSLRGDSMVDVIFSGSSNRNPSSLASVCLIFDNSDNYLSIEYKEVSIKRTVYKDGENEYYINNQKCRLKDILDLFIDSGVGRESFNIISQGDISNILSSKPEDRRVIFESAAGVLKYKKRKEDALRKLTRTNDNIDRVNDILNELEVQISPLKEQSKAAQKYLDLKKELEDKEISLIVVDVDKLNNEYSEIKNKKELLNEELINLEVDTSVFDGNLESKKLEHSKLVLKSEELNKKLLDQVTLVEKLNSEKTIITDRKKYSVDDVKLHNNLISAKEEKLKLENKITGIKKDVDDIKIQISSYDKVSLEKEKQELMIDRNRIISEIASMEKDKINLEFKIKNLESSIENNSDLYYSVRVILNNNIKGIYGVIGKLIEFDSKYSTAIDTAISSSSQFIVCEDEISAKNAINYLKSNNYGRATFLPLSVIEERNIDPVVLRNISTIPGFLSVAADLVSYDSKYKKAILNQLGNIIVAKDIDSANAISKIINHRYRVVTLDGELLHVGGSITGGTKSKTSSVILDKMDLEKYKNQIESIILSKKALEEKLVITSKKIEILDSKVNQVNIKMINLEELLIIKTNIFNEYSKTLEDIIRDLSSTQSMLDDTLSNEEDKIIERYFEALSIKDSLIKDIAILNSNIDTYVNEINEIEHNVKLSNSKYNKIKNEIQELELRQTKVEVKLDNLLQVLNEEYNMTFEKAKHNYVMTIDYSIARERVIELKNTIKNLGIVNLGAIDEYARVSSRYEFLNTQKSDLYKAENTLRSIILEMDNVMKVNFFNTFKQIQKEFKFVFKKLFGGGDAELKLTDPNNLLETGIDIIALPPGKKLQSISLLSGGEKALTAIALLFSVLRVRPVPFCLLDEVEAPLDELNVNNFGEFLREYDSNTQFIVITHKKKTMEYADTLYGITMQESGVSKLVSVRLKEI